MLSVSLFCDEVSGIGPHVVRSLRRPGLVFRVPDHPTVVIRPRGALQREDEAGEAHALDFASGKSCLLEWDSEPPASM